MAKNDIIQKLVNVQKQYVKVNFSLSDTILMCHVYACRLYDSLLQFHFFFIYGRERESESVWMSEKKLGSTDFIG